jgi:F-type H+-transporting ATPase subunit delta
MTNMKSESARHDTVMDVTEERIARVYARAFLSAIAKRDNSAALVDEVQSLVEDVLVKFPSLEKTLRSSLVSQEQKEQILQNVFGPRASEIVLNFMRVLAKHGRLELLRPIARLLKKLYAEHLGLAEVEVRVASPLDAGLQQEIFERLRQMLGAEPVLRVTVDRSLIAGLVIRVGDRVYDGSVSTRFEMLRRAMVERAVERIETRRENFVVA